MSTREERWTALPDGLAGLVRRAASRTPNAPAVHCGQASITYAELDLLAARYAAGFGSRGVAAGDRVVLWAEKSIDMVAIMQALLRLGAIYVPLAPSNPPERVLRVVADARPVLVLADDDTPLRGWPAGPDLSGIAAFCSGCVDAVARPAPTVDPDTPAYVLYTSGSTGSPKGVCLSHDNALAFVAWASHRIGLHGGDRLANHAPFNFDLSVFDLYGAFWAGAAVDLFPSGLAYAADALVEFLVGRHITVWYSVPSALVLMIRYGGLLEVPVPVALRVCLFAGEPFPVHHAIALRRAWPDVRMFNWFGPTETNVCNSYELTAADLDRMTPLPIGGAASEATVVLDDGEIVVSGPTVMRGYWGGPPHEGSYRTGDLGRYDSEGRLEYVGRRDAMVKLRGHRIELGEIEVVLARHESVSAAAVLVTGSGLDAELHAVVVPAGNTRPGLLALKGHCAQYLPRYMIVDRLSVVPELPRTPNGKLDRAGLKPLTLSPLLDQ